MDGYIRPLNLNANGPHQFRFTGSRKRSNDLMKNSINSLCRIKININSVNDFPGTQPYRRDHKNRRSHHHVRPRNTRLAHRNPGLDEALCSHVVDYQVPSTKSRKIPTLLSYESTLLYCNIQSYHKKRLVHYTIMS